MWFVKKKHAMTLVDPYVVCGKNTHAMTVVDPYVVCGCLLYTSDAADE